MTTETPRPKKWYSTPQGIDEAAHRMVQTNALIGGMTRPFDPETRATNAQIERVAKGMWGATRGARKTARKVQARFRAIEGFGEGPFEEPAMHTYRAARNMLSRLALSHFDLETAKTVARHEALALAAPTEDAQLEQGEQRNKVITRYYLNKFGDDPRGEEAAKDAVRAYEKKQEAAIDAIEKHVRAFHSEGTLLFDLPTVADAKKHLAREGTIFTALQAALDAHAAELPLSRRGNERVKGLNQLLVTQALNANYRERGDAIELNEAETRATLVRAGFNRSDTEEFVRTRKVLFERYLQARKSTP